MNIIKTIYATGVLLLAAMADSAYAQPDWEVEVRKADAVLWQANNSCDMKLFQTVVADDVEFYHDYAGPMIGKAKFTAMTKNALCGYPGEVNRRQAVAGTVRVWPLRVRGPDSAVYGALVEGEHEFFRSENKAPEVNLGRGRFSHLMLLKGKSWKVARIVSYDHRDSQKK